MVRGQPWIADALVKVLPLTVLVVVVWGMGRTTTGLFGIPVNPAVMFVLEMVCVLPLALSRSRPALMAIIVAVGAVSQMLAFYGPGVAASLAVPMVVHSCAKYGSRRASLTALAMALGGAIMVGIHIVVSHFIDPPGTGLGTADTSFTLFMAVLSAGFCAAVVLAAWLLGHLAGRRRREVEAIAEKNRLLERERHHEAEMAAEAERMRIAREMHDVISHSMSAMIAQADGGRYVLDADPEQARAAFASVSETGREALTELRRMLGVLREEGELKRRPSPGVESLAELAADMEASGVVVELHVAHSRMPALTEGAALAVYRIVQEALTNTLKHGGSKAVAQVWIGPDEQADELVVMIRDDGEGERAHDDGAGTGLRGMSERVHLYGGTLRYGVPARMRLGDLNGSGFEVEARFPLDRIRTERIR